MTYKFAYGWPLWPLTGTISFWHSLVKPHPTLNWTLFLWPWIQILSQTSVLIRDTVIPESISTLAYLFPTFTLRCVFSTLYEHWRHSALFHSNFHTTQAIRAHRGGISKPVAGPNRFYSMVSPGKMFAYFFSGPNAFYLVPAGKWSIRQHVQQAPFICLTRVLLPFYFLLSISRANTGIFFLSSLA